MRARIDKCGNHLRVRIPKALARELDFDEGTIVEVRVSGRNLILAPVRREFTLSELVAGITPRNRHRMTDWGPPAGNESW